MAYLEAEDARHALRVLRLDVGAQVHLFADGQAYAASICQTGPDGVAVAALIAPELFRGEELYIEVETGGDYCRGATIADYYHQTGKRPNATVLLDVDRAGFVDLLVRAVGRYGEGM